MPEIPGVRADGDLLKTLQRDVATLLGRDKASFPGAQPVSFAARHMSALQKQDYYVCEKSDGIRCLLYLTNDGPNEVTYLIDRKNDYYWVDRTHFPIPNDETLFHTNTIVDGELVNDTQPNGTLQLKYLVFDCLVLDGNSLMQRTLDKRLAYFRDKVYTPYKALYKSYPEEIQYLKFIVEFKQMELAYGIKKLFQEILPNLPHGNDGLIFTCRSTPYKFATDEHILKWKPENENSIDFVLSLSWPMLDPDSEDEREGRLSPIPDYSAMPTFDLLVLTENGYLKYGTMFVEPQEWEEMKALGQPLDDRVVECWQDRQNRWRYLRFRDDKKEANYITTVEKVIESIQDKVSESDLINIAPRIREEWKKREARAKEEEARRRMQAPTTTINGQNHHGNSREFSSGSKRKLEDLEPSSTSAADDSKRRNTPQPEA